MTHDGSFNELNGCLQQFRLVRAIQRGFLRQMNRSRIAIALIGEITFMDTKVLILQTTSTNLDFDVC
jgi:hypothetical protein